MTRIDLTDKDFHFNEDTGKLEIDMKRFDYKVNPVKKQILEDYEFRNSMNGAMQNQDSVLVSESELQKYKQFAESVNQLVEDGFFNEPIYDGQGNFDQNDYDKTNKLKQLIEGLK